MKNTKKSIVCFIMILLICVVAGCENESTSKSAVNATENLQKAVQKILPPHAQLYVSDGIGKKQSIYQTDIDQDGEKEAVVLYQNPTDNKQIHMMILKNKANHWTKIIDTSLNAYVLDYFDFIAFHKGEKESIVIGEAQTKEDANKHLEIYNMEKNNLQLIQAFDYHQFQIDDFLKNSDKELMLFDGTIGQEQTAKFYANQKGSFVLQSQVNLEAYAEHEHVITGNLSDDTKAVFVDSGVGAHSLLTEVVFMSNGKLKLLGNTSDSNYLKDIALYSKDINQDGVIEIAKTILPTAYADAATAEIPTIAEYADIDQNGNRVVNKTVYVDEGENFEIEIPTEQEKDIKITKETTSLTVQNQATNQVLYKVQWAKQKEVPQNVIVLKKAGDIVYYRDKETYVIADEAFHLLEENFN